MLFGKEDVCRIVDHVWTSVLDVEAQPAGSAGGEGAFGPSWTGVIALSVAGEGSVTLDCPVELAGHLAGRMFDVAPRETSAEQVRDALGELTNMLGGNLKTLLPEATLPGLPAVAASDELPPRFPPARCLLQAAFRCQGSPFRVTVFQRELPAGCLAAGGS